MSQLCFVNIIGFGFHIHGKNWCGHNFYSCRRVALIVVTLSNNSVAVWPLHCWSVIIEIPVTKNNQGLLEIKILKLPVDNAVLCTFTWYKSVKMLYFILAIVARLSGAAFKCCLWISDALQIPMRPSNDTCWCRAYLLTNSVCEYINRSRPDPGRREKGHLKFLFSHFVVPQKVLWRSS